MTVKLLLPAALAAVLYLAAMGGASLQAQETTEVHGRVVNGTEGADLPSGLSVLMLVTNADGRLAGTGQAEPDVQGRFVFEDVEIIDGGSYTVSVDHEGVFYGLSLGADDLAEDLTLTVFETTNDASIIQVERQVMVVAAVNKGQRTVSVIEFVRVVNPTDRTLLPDLANVPPISFLRFALPPSAAELTVQSDLPGGDIVSIGTGFALTSPVMPGAHSIDFSYTFPYDGDAISYRKTLAQGAGIFQVLIPETIPNMAVPGLNEIDPVNIQGTSYRAYESRDLPPGQGLALEITGLPLPGVWSRFADSVTSGSFWQTAIPSALGATLAAMLLWGLIRGRRPGDKSSEPEVSSMAVDPAERAAVVRAVAALDQRFQEGGVPETDYQGRRQELLARVLRLPISGQDMGPDEEKEPGE